MNYQIYIILFILICIIGIVLAFSQSRQSGKVVFVADGDTIIIENLSRKQFKIRLEHIDAPESNQAYGEASKEFLYSLIFGKTVSVKTDKKDKYGRHIGVVFYGRTNVNLASIEAGMSWHTKDFSNNPQFAKAEEEARESMSGLWSDPDATPPWRYRKYQSRS